MSTDALTTEPGVVVKSRQAAYCARRRLEDAELSAADMEAMIQSAALIYWKHALAGMSVAYCFVAARDAAEKCYYRADPGPWPSPGHHLAAWPSFIGGRLANNADQLDIHPFSAIIPPQF